MPASGLPPTGPRWRGTAALPPHLLLITLPFPFIVWGADEIRRYLLARAAARGDVPGLGAQRRPGGSARSFGGNLGCGDRAVIVADLDMLMQFPPGHARSLP